MKRKLWNKDFILLLQGNAVSTIGDLMYSVADNDSRFPNLIIDNKVYPLSKELRLDCWIDVSLKINPADKSITLTYDGEEVRTDGSDILPTDDLRVYFGKCTVAQFDLDNVASINLKDIRISQKGESIREWDLRFHQNDIDFCHNILRFYL